MAKAYEIPDFLNKKMSSKKYQTEDVTRECKFIYFNNEAFRWYQEFTDGKKDSLWHAEIKQFWELDDWEVFEEPEKLFKHQYWFIYEKGTEQERWSHNIKCTRLSWESLKNIYGQPELWVPISVDVKCDKPGSE